jgi:hypothetical protein
MPLATYIAYIRPRSTRFRDLASEEEEEEMEMEEEEEEEEEEGICTS